ncbi:TetR family transcriptional regulator [Veronia nyctiphanis]|uniref:TetR family transcriptional regulator n=1 Tax=Veronia nyctiphanis TaxID=1278244 RepID=A0A4Q0YTJ8_9GAMM|nr:TetR/AcrR family transcriptional regulator [Veronia nyctiphanis]RXJ73494.1 TetR family transcriptional regulator [Veronia nyctiphanis]
MKTRERIIQSALALFNEQGEPNVTTNHIAADLGISPGNLYYHFRNKEEIIHCIFDQYAIDLGTAFLPNPETDMLDQQKLLTYLDAAFQLMWRYRFFYANLPDILRRDAVLQEKYITAQHSLQRDLVAMMAQFRDTGFLNLDDDDLDGLGDTLKLVASSWIFYQSVHAPATQVTKGVIYQGVVKILKIVSPLTTPIGKQVVLGLIEHYKAQIDQE